MGRGQGRRHCSHFTEGSTDDRLRLQLRAGTQRPDLRAELTPRHRQGSPRAGSPHPPPRLSAVIQETREARAGRRRP